MPSSENHATGKKLRKGRLQRPPTATGYRVTTFGEVVARHGGTMGCLAALCLMLPGGWQAITSTTSQSLLQPGPYLLALFGLLVFFAYWSRRRPHSLKRQSQWVLYLLFIYVAEEVTFRLIFPSLLSSTSLFSSQVPLLTAHVISNFIFAAIHYVTLRWKLTNCIVTFFGAMGLSYLMRHGDLTMVVMVHWLGTFLNTPFPPAQRKA